MARPPVGVIAGDGVAVLAAYSARGGALWIATSLCRQGAHSDIRDRGRSDNGVLGWHSDTGAGRYSAATRLSFGRDRRDVRMRASSCEILRGVGPPLVPRVARNRLGLAITALGFAVCGQVALWWRAGFSGPASVDRRPKQQGIAGAKQPQPAPPWYVVLGFLDDYQRPAPRSWMGSQWLGIPPTCSRKPRRSAPMR